MLFNAIISAAIISVPFWLIEIFLVEIGLVTLSTITFLDLAIVGLAFFLFLTAQQSTTIRFPCYEVRHIGHHEWHIVSEKEAMERLADFFDPITPTISKILQGEEIIVSNEIYRLLSAQCY